MSTTAPAFTANSPILARATGSPESAAHWIAARADYYDLVDIREIVGGYKTYGELLDVHWWLALGQMCKETGPFDTDDFWGRRPRRNACGFGVNGRRAKTIKEAVRGHPYRLDRPTAITILMPGISDPHWEYDPKEDQWRAGTAFARWVPRPNDVYSLLEPSSIIGHLGRLLAFALKDGEGTPEQQAARRFALDLRPLRADYHGCARTWNDLNGKWNGAVTTYPQDVARIANQLRGAR